MFSSFFWICSILIGKKQIVILQEERVPVWKLVLIKRFKIDAQGNCLKRLWNNKIFLRIASYIIVFKRFRAFYFILDTFCEQMLIKKSEQAKVVTQGVTVKHWFLYFPVCHLDDKCWTFSILCQILCQISFCKECFTIPLKIFKKNWRSNMHFKV